MAAWRAGASPAAAGAVGSGRATVLPGLPMRKAQYTALAAANAHRSAVISRSVHFLCMPGL